jgi:BirA family transcriptional regulator, biotin operon repressor / biotin---[acetyl-CoA-carboxylase] ligase
VAGQPLISWQRRWLPVCASTETELARWLLQQPCPPLLQTPRLVVAGRQRFGHGQHGRHWSSPAGGLWLSAALPWPQPGDDAAPPTLAVALGLALQLEALGLQPRIKWPNDLMLDGRKLAGILTHQRLRGTQVRWLQVGLGLNGINRVPAGAVAVGEALQRQRGRGGCFHPWATPQRLLPRALAGLHWASLHANQGQLVQRETARRAFQTRARPLSSNTPSNSTELR